MYRIRDISTSRSLWQRMFGVGSITVVSSDKTAPTLLLKNVKNPLDVKELLHRQVEEVKIRRRIRVGEIMTDVPEDLPEESDAQWHDEDDME